MIEDWDDLRYFLAAMRAGSLTAAATTLGVQQSTMSRRIKALEERLGQPLFERRQGGLVATALARAWLNDTERIEQQVLTLDAIAQSGQGASPKGLVRITTTEPLASALLLPQLHLWRQRYPLIEIELLTGNQSLDMARREAEIALRFIRPTRGDLCLRKLTSMPRAILASRELIANHPSASLTELSWIVFELPDVQTPEHRWHEQHIKRPALLHTSSYTLLLDALRQGLGAGIAVSVMREQRAPQTQLIELSPPPDAQLPPPLELWLVTHNALRELPHIDAIWSELEALALAL